MELAGQSEQSVVDFFASVPAPDFESFYSESPREQLGESLLDLFGSLRFEDESEAALAGDNLPSAYVAAPEPDLFWIGKDLIRLAQLAAPTLPDWSPALALPSRHGFAEFALPLDTLTIEQGQLQQSGMDETVEVSIDAVRWDHWEAIELATTEFYSRDRRLQRGNDEATELVSVLTQSVYDQFVTQKGELPHGAPFESERRVQQQAAARRDNDLTGQDYVFRTASLDSVPMLISKLASVWLMMSGESGTEERSETVKGRRQRSTQGKRRQAGDIPVRVVNWNRPVAGAPGNKRSAEEQRQYQSRWWVRGHWRQQVYGPKRALRKPVWIEPHTAGPQDKPLRESKPVVYRVDRRDEP